ncbi:conjugative transfer signal peptidase TraF [Rhizobium cauense]|uniref:conjugative transfer signal peptidase TraF n=1 Tax=Rhizobium cauense TaxID=1166683 RepID=UPI001C6E5717|nr:conjugative transfer signal peptidase TraF [Rhizobium cauense]MBW9114728.1 conjugative transfer signal peptidase TraF [Rhizobium cauense]
MISVRASSAIWAPLRRPLLLLPTVIILTVPVGLLAGGLVGFRVNLTPSEPLGLWYVQPLKRPVAVGDRVFVCPPQSKAMHLARERGYLRGGLCPSGYAPLIKTIVATAGHRVDVDRVVAIDGVTLAHSTLLRRDGKGRTLTAYTGGMISAGEVFVHSSFAGSYDSRYFGPVPAPGILGLAEEVLTYAP